MFQKPRGFARRKWCEMRERMQPFHVSEIISFWQRVQTKCSRSSSSGYSQKFRPDDQHGQLAPSRLAVRITDLHMRTEARHSGKEARTP
jgi:hypothetical protein